MNNSLTIEGLDLIKKYEGLSLTKYICPAGIPTIGYGHQITQFENLSFITQEQAEILLLADIKIAEFAVVKLIEVGLSDNQFSALVSFCFNLGSGALQRSSLRQKVNRGEHEEAAEEFNKWVYAGGKKLAGLILRRAEEAEMYSYMK